LLNGEIKENPSVFSVEMVLKAKNICFSNVVSVQEFGGKVWIDVMYWSSRWLGWAGKARKADMEKEISTC